MAQTAHAPAIQGGTLRPQALMIDADDTLWENNIYFERAIDRFVDLLAHPGLSPAEVRNAFDRLEATRIHVHGYGTHAFQNSMLASFEHLSGCTCTPEQQQALIDCAESIRSAEMTLLDGVLDTLPQLASRHTLILVTKGNHEEQVAKLQQSGLQHHFRHVRVLREKHREAYLDLCAHFELDAAHTWMIGNSPRSDINPALAAGMHAVYLPHHSTWVHEQENVASVPSGQQLLELRSFRELAHHF